MPSLYLFDNEDGRWRRPWARMLPPGYIEVSIEADSFRHEGLPARDGIVVAHASRLPAPPARGRLWRSARDAGLSLVLVSGGAQEHGAGEAHVYCRRRPVRTGDLDEEFARDFARFWEHRVGSGETCFALLEPGRDMLTALHVLCRGVVLAHEAARPEDAAWAAETRQSDWWRALEVPALRRELEERGSPDTRLERLLDLIASGRPVPPETARQALDALRARP